MLIPMLNTVPAPVARALENALYPILHHLVLEHGAESLREGLMQVAHQGHRIERRERDREAKRKRQPRAATPPSQLPRPVVELSERQAFDIRRRHHLVEERGADDDVTTARADRGALLGDNDRLRTELLRVVDELDDLRSQIAIADQESYEEDVARLGVLPTCSSCGDEVREVYPLAAASRWLGEGEHDEYDRDVEVCEACGRGEKPAAAPVAAEPPRPRLASGTRRLPAPMRKAG